MKRRLIIMLCVFLLLGAVVNVAVAWALAIGIDVIPLHTRSSHRLSGRLMHGVASFESVGSQRLIWSTEDIGYSIVAPSDSFDVAPPAAEIAFDWSQNTSVSSRKALPLGVQHEWRTEDARGWPMLSLAWDHVVTQGTAGIAESMSMGIQMPMSHSGQWVALALRPLVQGFFLNTLFYTGISIALVAAFKNGVRRRRMRRGLCAKCAYPVGGSDVCTECGAAVLYRKPNAKSKA